MTTNPGSPRGTRPGARLFFAALLVTAPAALAQETAQPAQSTSDLEALLGESVVTTASRTAERASVAPATVFNITAAEMRASGVRTVDEALEQLGQGIYTSKPRDYSTGSDVGAQGLLLRDAGRHVLVMLDGVALNSQGTGRVSVHEALGVPLELIDHIEVMLGPGSVAYGSNAMLGVINVVTLRARDLHGIFASAELGSSLAQDGDGNPTTASGTQPGLRYHLALGAGGKFKLGGFDGEVTTMLDWTQERSASYGVLPFSSADAGNQSLLPGQTVYGGDAFHRLRAPAGVLTVRLGDFKLLVNVFDYYRNMPLVGTFSDSRARESQSGVRVDLAHSLDLGERFTLDTRVYGGYTTFAERSVYGESYWCIAGQDNGCVEEMSARTTSLGLEMKLAADWHGDGKLATTLGYDLRGVFFDSTPANYTDLVTGLAPSDLALPHSNESVFLGALFLQQVWSPLHWLALNLGGRLDFQTAFGQRLSPRAAVVLTPAEGTTLRLTYNEAFRAPSLYETTEFDPTYRITPQHLRPETVRSAEAELRQQLSRLTVSLRGYYASYNDLIESRVATLEEVTPFLPQLSSTVDPSQVRVNDNLTALAVVGGSVAPQLRLPYGFTLAGSLNLSRAQSDNGVLNRGLPRWFGNLRAGWQAPGDGLSIMWTSVFSGQRRVSFNEMPIDSFIGGRFDQRLTASGKLGDGALAGLRWRATVGFDLNAQLPYAIATGTDTPSGISLYPDQPRVYGFVGVQYRGEGSAR